MPLEQSFTYPGAIGITSKHMAGLADTSTHIANHVHILYGSVMHVNPIC